MAIQKFSILLLPPFVPLCTVAGTHLKISIFQHLKEKSSFDHIFNLIAKHQSYNFCFFFFGKFFSKARANKNLINLTVRTYSRTPQQRKNGSPGFLPLLRGFPLFCSTLLRGSFYKTIKGHIRLNNTRPYNTIKGHICTL